MERWASRLEGVSRAAGSIGFARWASELARSLRSAGAALEFVDEDDEDAVFDVLTRLDLLKRDAEGLLSRLGSNAWEERTVVRSVPPFDEAVTAVMARSALQ